MDASIYYCVECKRFFAWYTHLHIYCRGISIEETTALRLADAHQRNFVCEDCSQRLSRESVMKVLSTPPGVRAVR